jgi:hypothetical protein
MIPGSLTGPVKNPDKDKVAVLFLSGYHQRNA